MIRVAQLTLVAFCGATFALAAVQIRNTRRQEALTARWNILVTKLEEVRVQQPETETAIVSLQEENRLRVLAAALGSRLDWPPPPASMGIPRPIVDLSPIKIGILHSLSGTMATSETSLKDIALMTIDELNAAGGVLGRKLEPVVVDPASNWPLFAEKARELLQHEGVAVTFGCWTSVSRKSVLPVYEELNGLLFYPVQYEGEESSYNVFYTGPTPNQQAIPALEYIISSQRGATKRWFLLGTDYIYSRTTNKVLRYFLTHKGVSNSDIEEQYTLFDDSDYRKIVASMRTFSKDAPTAVISTLVGDSNSAFHKELANQGVNASDIAVVSLSISEEELREIDTKPLVGHLAARNYFMSIDNPLNRRFVADWKAWVMAKNLPDGERRVTTDAMEATYVGIHMWRQAVEQAGTADVNAVRQALRGQTFNAPSGQLYLMDTKNHHLHKRVYVGKIKADGQFDVVWKTEDPIRATPWSPFVPQSAKKVADWSFPWVCGNCTEPRFKTDTATAALE